jgi:protein involved in polysaccharide export with SLBB domain
LQAPDSPDLEPPRELSKVMLPAYRVEPPDVIRLEVLKLVPRQPYRIDTYDVLQIRAYPVWLQHPIDDYFLVEEDGNVTLPPAYGVVRVAGMTITEAAAEIVRGLRLVGLNNPTVTVQLSRSASAQDISRDYTIGPDGVIHISRFGAVYLAGKTVTEAQLAIQDHLAQYFASPRVGVAVVRFNSEGYYTITANALKNNEVRRFPITGNETVLDAIAEMPALSNVATKTMWIARPAPGDCRKEQILPIDWSAIARGGETKTNYQILPGDRLFIVDDKLVAANSCLDLFASPIERLLNVTNLGTSTVRVTQEIGRAYDSNKNF